MHAFVYSSFPRIVWQRSKDTRFKRCKGVKDFTVLYLYLFIWEDNTAYRTVRQISWKLLNKIKIRQVEPMRPKHQKDFFDTMKHFCYKIRDGDTTPNNKSRDLASAAYQYILEFSMLAWLKENQNFLIKSYMCALISSGFSWFMK